jgi:hypothetical protein
VEFLFPTLKRGADQFCASGAFVIPYAVLIKLSLIQLDLRHGWSRALSKLIKEHLCGEHHHSGLQLLYSENENDDAEWLFPHEESTFDNAGNST